jgi:uncharacterized membrane protein
MTFEQTPEGKLRATGRTRNAVIAVDRGVLGFARHWLLWFNLFIFAYVGIPFLAPVLMHYGYNETAKVIYTVYSPLCHQLGYRSWFLFGEQAHYPRQDFAARTGIQIDSPAGLLESKGFNGNAGLGYKVAFCQRDVAIYGGILLAGLIYGLPPVRRRLKPLHWVGWIVIGLAPIALDGFSQLFTQYPYSDIDFFRFIFGWLPSRESTPFYRTLTGGLFGLANVWLAYPYVEQSMREVKDDLERKLARAASLSQ